MKDEKDVSPKVETKGSSIPFLTTAEKAQYEVFQNGALPRDTIEKWIRNDLTAVMSFVHGILNDPDIFPAVVDLYFKKYQALHGNLVDQMHAPKPNANEPKRTAAR